MLRPASLLLALALLLLPALLLPADARAQTPATTVEDGVGNVVFQTIEEGGLLAPGAFGTGTIPAEGAGTRLMWHPAKAAVRAGRVGDASGKGDIWDADSVGQYSVAMGRDTKAQDEGAVALGDATTAGNGTNTFGGSAAVAMGSETTASGFAATALGLATTAGGARATAMGSGTTASAFAATAIGNETTASGDWSTAMGNGTTASSQAATAMGIGTAAATDQSLSIGECNSANASADGTLFAVGTGDYDFGSDNCTSRGDAFTVDTGGSATASSHDTFSDRRLKTAIEPLGEGVLRKLANLRPVRYQFENQSTHPSGEQLGLIAQNVRKEFPALVSEGADGMLSLAYPKLTAVLLKGLQEQQAQLEKKDEKIAELQEAQKQIRNRLAALESQARPAAAGWVGGTPLRGLALLMIGGVLGAGLLHLRRR